MMRFSRCPTRCALPFHRPPAPSLSGRAKGSGPPRAQRKGHAAPPRPTAQRVVADCSADRVGQKAMGQAPHGLWGNTWPICSPSSCLIPPHPPDAWVGPADMRPHAPQVSVLFRRTCWHMMQDPWQFGVGLAGNVGVSALCGLVYFQVPSPPPLGHKGRGQPLPRRPLRLWPIPLGPGAIKRRLGCVTGVWSC